MVKVASEADRETRPRRRPRRRLSGRPGLPRRAPRRLPRGDPRGPGHLVGAERRAALPDRDPQLDDARPRSRGGPPDRPRGARVDRGRAPGDRPRAPASATTPPPTARALDADPANSPQTKDELVARATEDIERAMAVAPRFFGVLPTAPLRGPPGRGVQGEGRAVRLLLPAGARRLAAGHLLRQRLRPAEPQVHQARHDDLPRGRARPPLPDHARDGEPAPQHVPAARGADGRRRLRRGLGPVQRAAGRRDGPLPRRGASASGCSTRRRGAPPGSSSTPGCTRCAGRASARSTSSRRPGLSETDAVIETDRYICWPGQALTYKIGQREIERLRAELVGARRLGVRPARVPRRGARPRVAAAGDAQPRAAELAGHPGLTSGGLARAAFGGRVARCRVISSSRRSARYRDENRVDAARERMARWPARLSHATQRPSRGPSRQARTRGPAWPPSPPPAPTPRSGATAQTALYARALRDAARRHRLELPGLGRRHDLRRSRQGRHGLGHRRQRVHRPADGLRPGHPRPRRRARRRLRQRADAQGRQLLAHLARTRSRRWSWSRS